jgi:hypothetical protein
MLPQNAAARDARKGSDYDKCIETLIAATSAAIKAAEAIQAAADAARVAEVVRMVKQHATTAAYKTSKFASLFNDPSNLVEVQYKGYKFYVPK